MALNQATWQKRSASRDLDGVAAYTDRGERAALERIAEEVRGRPILDLGVGTGRTVRLLRPLTQEYFSLDLSPLMVEIARARYPGVRVDLADARTLEGYPSGHFALVNFSWCGIDAMPPGDRRAVLEAARRVLAVDGFFVHSVLNLDGPSFRERPWRLRFWPTKNPVRLALGALGQLAGMPLNLRNWLRIRHAGECGPGYAVAPLSAHRYSILAHFTTLERQLLELEEFGFDPTVVFESRHGRCVLNGDDSSATDWFHIVARRRGRD